MSECPYTVAFEAPDVRLSDDVLLRLRFGKDLAASGEPGDVVVPLEPVAQEFAEVWRSRRPVRRGEHEGIAFACDGEVLMGHVRLDGDAVREPDAASEEVYLRIERTLRLLGYPHWLRVWNYLSGITEGEGDAERYRRFVVGRHRAMAEVPDFERSLPAATAIGMHRGGLLVYFLAATSPGLQVENPRQTSAFRYPRKYGPRSPSFSRATLKSWSDRTDLYVSGTASVVGHESLHVGDVLAQLQEIRRNVDALLQLAASRDDARGLEPLQLKFYIRDRREAKAVLASARDLFGGVPILAVEADICRADLLLEVEGIYSTAGAAAGASAGGRSNAHIE